MVHQGKVTCFPFRLLTILWTCILRHGADGRSLSGDADAAGKRPVGLQPSMARSATTQVVASIAGGEVAPSGRQRMLVGIGGLEPAARMFPAEDQGPQAGTRRRRRARRNPRRRRPAGVRFNRPDAPRGSCRSLSGGRGRARRAARRRRRGDRRGRQATGSRRRSGPPEAFVHH